MITHSVEETRQQKEQWGGGWRRGWGVKKKNEKRWGRGRGNTFLNASSSFVKGRFNFFHMRLENITCFIASKNILEKQVRLRT